MEKIITNETSDFHLSRKSFKRFFLTSLGVLQKKVVLFDYLCSKYPYLCCTYLVGVFKQRAMTSDEVTCFFQLWLDLKNLEFEIYILLWHLQIWCCNNWSFQCVSICLIYSRLVKSDDEIPKITGLTKRPLF